MKHRCNKEVAQQDYNEDKACSGGTGEESTHAEGGVRQPAQADKDGCADDPRVQAQAAKGPPLGPHELRTSAAELFKSSLVHETVETMRAEYTRAQANGYWELRECQAWRNSVKRYTVLLFPVRGILTGPARCLT